MSDPEADHLAECSKAGVCPYCGKSIAKGTAVARGSGSFCSLDCVARYHGPEFGHKARRLRPPQN